MKKISKTFVVLLVAVIALFSFSVTAGAAEVNNSQDGLVASITSVKDSYKANEDIELTFKVTNTNDFAVENVSLEAIIPDGLTIKNKADTSIDTVSLASGESLEFTLTVVKESSVIVVPIGDSTEPSTENATVATSVTQAESIQATTINANSATSDTSNTNGSDNTSIKTGNNMPYWIAGLICLVCLAVAVFAFRFRKKSVKYLSLVLCVCVSVGSVAVLCVTNTMAEETTNEKIQKNEQIMTIEIVKYITVENKEYRIESIVKYTDPIGKQNNEFIPLRDADSYVSDDFYNTSPEKNHKTIDKDTGTQFINNEIEICVKDNTSDNEIETLCLKYNAQIVSKIKSLNSFKLRFKKSYSYSELQEIINNLNKENCIDESSLVLVMRWEPSVYYPTSKKDRWTDDWDSIPSGANWGIEAIKAPGAWEYIDLMKEVNVGVYDQGFDTQHEDLKNVIKTSLLYPANPTNHGTHVTGIIGAEYENSIGIDGVCPTAKFSLYNYNENETDDSVSFKFAMDYLVEQNNSKVINISLGPNPEILFAASKGEFSAQEYLKKLSIYCEKTLNRLLDSNFDFVICTSAGNNRGYSYYKSDEAPYGYYLAGDEGTYLDRESGKYLKWNGNSASISGNNQSMADWKEFSLINNENIKNRIIVVGAIQNQSDTTEKYALCSFSDIGDRVDVVAPGYDIESTVSNNNYEGGWSGTSMASPHVAGIAAMLYSLDPDLTGDEVKRIICETATNEVDGYKLVDAETAVKKVLGQGSLSGNVVSSDNNEPLSNVRVDVYSKLKSGTKFVDNTYTNDKGNFSMKLQSGSYELRFNKDGYKTASQTIKISNDVITSLKDPIVMEKEDTYKEDFINALINNQTSWNTPSFGNGNSMTTQIYFMDINFDDKLELVTDYMTGSGGTCVEVYGYQNGQIVHYNIDKNAHLIDSFNYYYDTAEKKYRIFGTDTTKFCSDTSQSHKDMSNYELVVINDTIYKDFYTSYCPISGYYDLYRKGSPVDGYTEGVYNYNIVGPYSDSQSYDKSNSERLKNSIKVDINKNTIISDDWKIYSDFEKKEALEKSYDSFTYDKY